MAAEQGLILVDTKYEFGRYQDDIILIDEIHTPDSSRYYISEGYEHRQRSGEKQKQLSKEFVREWLMSNGFQGLEGQTMPQMPEAFIASVTDRYEELYTKLTGQKLEKLSYEGIHQSIQDHVVNYLQKS
jgi:phosphoribosylaminoimidazole-succinocarboxamide synthase